MKNGKYHEISESLNHNISRSSSLNLIDLQVISGQVNHGEPSLHSGASNGSGAAAAVGCSVTGGDVAMAWANQWSDTLAEAPKCNPVCFASGTDSA